VSIQFFHPDVLRPEELDAFLAAGWFRMRQSVFTCRFVLEGGDLHTAVWIRTALQGYRFKKSLRRVLSRNDRRFEVRIGPLVLDEEKEALYQRYRGAFSGDLAPTLVDGLYDDDQRDIFDTWQTEVREGGRLVAFSVFDRGRRAIESIMGIWDPGYRREGLGLYTMLLEVRYGRDEGFDVFYPGYVAPGCTAFDYKLRLDGVEYLDPHGGGWRPIEDMDEASLPSSVYRQRLGAVEAALEDLGVTFERRLYPLYRLVAVDERLTRCLDVPLFVECHPGRGEGVVLALTWSQEEETYSLLACIPIADLKDRFAGRTARSGEGPRPCLELLRPVARIARSGRPEGIARCVISPDRLKRQGHGVRQRPSEPPPAPLASDVLDAPQQGGAEE
jgi:arginyl-tRNA--protein-N-Asp/Glu arginylyltransferase